MLDGARTPRFPYPLWSVPNGRAAQEVVCTDGYLPTLLQMIGDDYDPGGADTTRTVELIPEPDNSDDRYAVSVRHDDVPIGYLPRADAIRYHRPLQELVDLGYVPTASARIWVSERADFDENGARAVRAHVHLVVAGPDTMLPRNDPPSAPYTIVPSGEPVAVLSTIDHFDVLRRYHAPSGMASILVTLHAVEQGPHAPRGVEVRLDGHRIGHLAPTTSDAYAPTCDYFFDHGLLCGARAVVQSSPIAATVTLYARKAYELTAADLESAPATIPTRDIAAPHIEPAHPPLEDTVHTGVTAHGSTITVTEHHRTSLVGVVFEFARPLTAWQQRIAAKVFAKAADLLASQRLDAPVPAVTDAELRAYAPLAYAQEFLDALIGVEESDFATVQEFCER